MDKLRSYDLASLAELLQVKLDGDATIKISGLATLANANEGDLSFYHNPLYFNDLLKSRASAVIISPQQADNFPGNKLIAEQPYICYARASHLFAVNTQENYGLAESAHIHPQARLGEKINIGNNTVVEAGASIADGVSIGANCVIGRNASIGKDSRLDHNVCIAHDVVVGQRAYIYSGVVIGSDGFGFAKEGEKYHKIAQLGSVLIGDDVEVGANTCIDRGALDDTRIGDGVKIDNQVQIAHNVEIGDNTVICGCSAVAGSARIGKNCVIAGGVGIINHVEITDNVTVTAMSLVNQSITRPGSYSSGTGLSNTLEWKKNIVRFRQLDSMAKSIKKYLTTK